MSRLCLNDIPMDLFFKYFNENNVDTVYSTPVMEDLRPQCVYVLKSSISGDPNWGEPFLIPYFKYNDTILKSLRPNITDHIFSDNDGLITFHSGVETDLSTSFSVDYKNPDDLNEETTFTISAPKIGLLKDKPIEWEDIDQKHIYGEDVFVYLEKETANDTPTYSPKLVKEGVFDIDGKEVEYVKYRKVIGELTTNLCYMPVLGSKNSTQTCLYNGSVLLVDTVTNKEIGIYPVTIELNFDYEGSIRITSIGPIMDTNNSNEKTNVVLTTQMYERLSEKYNDRFVQYKVLNTTTTIYRGCYIAKIFENEVVKIQQRDSNNNPIYRTRFGTLTTNSGAKSPLAYHTSAIRSCFYDIRNLDTEFFLRIDPRTIACIRKGNGLIFQHYQQFPKKIIYHPLTNISSIDDFVDGLLIDISEEEYSSDKTEEILEREIFEDLNVNKCPVLEMAGPDLLSANDSAISMYYQPYDLSTTEMKEYLNKPVIVKQVKKYGYIFGSKENIVNVLPDNTIIAGIDIKTGWSEYVDSGRKIDNNRRKRGYSVVDSTGSTSTTVLYRKLNVEGAETNSPFIVIPIYFSAEKRAKTANYNTVDIDTSIGINNSYFTAWKDLKIFYKPTFGNIFLQTATGIEYKGLTSSEMKETYKTTTNKLFNYISDLYGLDAPSTDTTEYFYLIINFDSMLVKEKYGKDLIGILDYDIIGAGASSYHYRFTPLLLTSTLKSLKELNIINHTAYKDIYIDNASNINNVSLDYFKDCRPVTGRDTAAIDGSNEISYDKTEPNIHVLFVTNEDVVEEQYWSREIYCSTKNFSKFFTKVTVIKDDNLAGEDTEYTATTLVLDTLKTQLSNNNLMVVDGYISKRGGTVPDYVIRNKKKKATKDIILDKLNNVENEKYKLTETFVGSNKYDRMRVYAEGLYNFIKYDPLYRLKMQSSVNATKSISDYTKYVLIQKTKEDDATYELYNFDKIFSDAKKEELKNRSAYKKLLLYKEYPLDIVYERRLRNNLWSEKVTDLDNTKITFYNSDISYYTAEDGNLYNGIKPIPAAFVTTRDDLLNPATNALIQYLDSYINDNYNEHLTDIFREKLLQIIENLKVYSETSLNLSEALVTEKKKFSTNSLSLPTMIGADNPDLYIVKYTTPDPPSDGSIVRTKDKPTSENNTKVFVKAIDALTIPYGRNGKTKGLITFSDDVELSKRKIPSQTIGFDNLVQASNDGTIYLDDRLTLQVKPDDRLLYIREPVVTEEPGEEEEDTTNPGYISPAPEAFIIDYDIYVLLKSLLSEKDSDGEWRIM